MKNFENFENFFYFFYKFFSLKIDNNSEKFFIENNFDDLIDEEKNNEFKDDLKKFRKNDGNANLNIESARNYLIEEEFKNCTFNSEEFYEKFNSKLEYRICISGEDLRFILDRVKQIEIVYKNEIKDFYDCDFLKGRKNYILYLFPFNF